MKRKHNTKNAESIFKYAQKPSVTLYVCSYTFAIAYHYMQKEENIPHRIAISLLEKLFPKVKCIPVDNVIIQQAMKSGFEDYEDAIQYYSALKIPGCDVIITRNAKDFTLSNIPVMTPKIFLRHQKIYKKSS